MRNITLTFSFLLGLSAFGQANLNEFTKALFSQRCFNCIHSIEAETPDMKMEPLLGEVLITDDSLIYFFEDHGVIIESMTSNKMSIVVNHTIGFVEYRQFQDDEFYFWAPPNFIMMIRYATEHGDTIWQSDINEVTVGFSENDKHISKMIFQYNESLGIEVYEDYVKGSTYRFLLKPGECENLNFPSIQFLESDSLVLPEEISHYSYRINKH